MGTVGCLRLPTALPYTHLPQPEIDPMRRDPRAPVLISRFLVRHRIVLAGALVCALFGCDDPTSTTPAAPQPAMLRVTGATGYLDIGQTVDLGAAVSDSTGKSLEGRTVIWSSSNPAVAEVVAGRVTGRAAGDAYIRAAVGKAADSVRITVEIPVADLRVAPDSLSLIAGRSGKLFVETTDAAGRPQPHSLVFSMSSAAFATVDREGKVEAGGLGSGVVRVTAGSKSVQVPVRVVNGQRYTARVLGTSGGGVSHASAVNNRGEVVGDLYVAGNATSHPFLWRQGEMMDLGLPPGSTNGWAAAISDRSVIVGTSERPHPTCAGCILPQTAWVWRSGTLSVIELPGENMEAVAGVYTPWIPGVDVNNRDQVVVQFEYCTSGGGSYCYIRSRIVQNGETTLISSQGAAAAINNLGVVALTTYRQAYQGPRDPQVDLWEGGRPSTGPAGMVARDVNDRGVVAGACGATASASANVGCTWDGTTVANIGGMTRANRINLYGDVLGIGTGTEVVLLRGGQLFRLEQMLDSGEWEILRADGINDLGQIAATGKSRTTGETRALLLTPS